MNTSEIKQTDSTSFTEHLDRDGKLWHNDWYYSQQNIAELTLREKDED